MRASLFPTLSKCLFVIGLSLSIILAFPGAKGILFFALSLVIGVLVIFLPIKDKNTTDNYHTPLLFDFLMIAAFTVALFSKEVPSKVYPMFICWQLGFILDVVYWLIDKQYEGKDVKQLIRSNLRLPLIVDFLIIAINVNGLITGKGGVNNILAFLLILFSLIDLSRQLTIIIKRGKFEPRDLL